MSAQDHPVPRVRLICSGCLVALKNPNPSTDVVYPASVPEDEIWVGMGCYELRKLAERDYGWEPYLYSYSNQGKDYCHDCKETDLEKAERASLKLYNPVPSCLERRSKNKRAIAREKRALKRAQLGEQTQPSFIPVEDLP